MWPILVLASAYAAVNVISPRVFGYRVDEWQDSYNWRMAMATVFYAVPAGICLAVWSQQGRQKHVFMGYALFCLFICVCGWGLIKTVGTDQFVSTNGDEVSRENGNIQGVKFLVFQAGNLMIDAIPMAVLAVTALSATIFCKWFWPRMVIWAAAALGIYFNLVVATRTMIVAAGAALVIVLTAQVLVSPHRKKLIGTLLAAGFLVMAAAGVYLVAKSDGGSNALMQRFTKVGDDTRLDVWRQAIPLIIDYPAGGGILHLGAESWGHNLFLDAALINGWLGFLVMSTLYAVIFFMVVSAVRVANILNEPLGVAMTAGLLGSFFSNMVHPPQPAFITFAMMVGCFAFTSVLEKDMAPAMERARRHADFRRFGARSAKAAVNGSNPSPA
jgi:O-antigen ligase